MYYNNNDELTRLIREMRDIYKNAGKFYIPLKKLYVGNLETGESYTINLENGEINNDDGTR